MVKKFGRNQKGFSLVEALLAVGISSAAGLAYMTYIQHATKHKQLVDTKSAISVLEAEAMEYLKSKEVCNDNMFKAFAKSNLNAASVKGDKSHSQLLSKSFVDSTGKTVSRKIFEVDDSFENDRIWVSDIDYSLDKLQKVTVPNSPWTTSGEFRIGVTFERCGDGGAVYRQEKKMVDGVSVNVGPKVPVCDNIIKHTKSFNKFAAFEVKADGLIAEADEKVYNPKTMKYETTGKTLPRASCADSQDALVDEAAKYTDKKVCLLDARMMANAGRQGVTSCNYTVKTQEMAIEKRDGMGTIDLPMSSAVVPGTLRFEIIGGGGGGGGASDDRGLGGKAGVFQSGPFSEATLGSTCSYTVGSGGTPGYDDKYAGGYGGTSTIVCSQGNVSINVSGGAGGASDVATKGGTDYGEAGESSHYGPGGAGGAARNGYTASSPGAGGSGAGDDAKSSYGGGGASGKVLIAWKTVQLFDESGAELDVIDGAPKGSRDPASPAAGNNSGAPADSGSNGSPSGSSSPSNSGGGSSNDGHGFYREDGVRKQPVEETTRNDIQ